MSPLAWITEHREVLGWIATSLFTLSFIVKGEQNLLRLQLSAASLWIFYGILIADRPVITANVLVAGGALYKTVRLATHKKGGLTKPSA